MFSHRISRRTKASTIAVMAVAGLLALGSQLPGDADAAIDPFVPYAALTNPELAELRGGFSFEGAFFNIAIEVRLKSLIDDIGLISILKFNKDGGIESSVTTFLPGPDPSPSSSSSSPSSSGPSPDPIQKVEVSDEGVKTSLITETTEIVHEINDQTIRSIVSTSGNGLSITNTVQFDINISKTMQAALNSFSKNILSNSIASHIGLSSLF